MYFFSFLDSTYIYSIVEVVEFEVVVELYSMLVLRPGLKSLEYRRGYGNLSIEWLKIDVYLT